MITRAIVFAVVLAASANTSLAQSKERIGRWVADVRVTSSGLPSEAGWTPVIPSGTEAPGRGLGFELGAHVYVWRWRALALGVGATWLTARSTATPAEVEGDTTTAPTIPEVTTRITTFAPQLSLNFGHSLGWSYLSAGLGRSNVESEATLAGSVFTPRMSDGVKTLNYGGGARWFLNDHLGVGFDVRWHNLSLVSASATHPGAPRASLIAAGAGIVLK
jgi:hypothetical protein